MVYVLNIDGQPLMPTNRHGKVRRLIKSKQVKIINILKKLYDEYLADSEKTLISKEEK